MTSAVSVGLFEKNSPLVGGSTTLAESSPLTLESGALESAARLSSSPPAATIVLSAEVRAMAAIQATGVGMTVKEFLAQRDSIFLGSAVISDTSANLSKYFSSLRKYDELIASIEVSNEEVPLRLSAAQFESQDGTSVAEKMSNASFSLFRVSAAQAGSLGSDSRIVSMAISDSSANIAASIDELGGVDADKLLSITQSGAKKPLQITLADFTANSIVLDKIRGTYNVHLTEVPISDGDDVATLTTVMGNSRVTSISVEASAAEIVENLDLLKSSRKVKSITPASGELETISFSPGQFSESFNRKLSGFDIAVAFEGDAANFDIETDSKGRRTITEISEGGGTYRFSNTVKFFQFDDKNLFGTTGDSRVDAILMGGEQYWWYNPTKSPVLGASRSSDAPQVTETAFALDGLSSRQTLKFAFLTSSDIDTYKNSANDANGFVEMTDEHKAGVKAALDYISSLVDLTFQEVVVAEADLKFGTNDQGTASGAYAYQPNSAANINIMLNNHGDPSDPSSIEASNSDMTQGTYGWATLIHEIGHALGLKHPGDYNAGGGGTPGPYLPVGNAGSKRFTIMSYGNIADGRNVTVAGGISSASYLNPSTFMSYDLAALQFLYGVNTTGQVNGGEALSGDDITGTTDFQTNTFDDDWRGFQTLYAPDSIEDFTIDLSGVTAKNIIDLRPGAYSSINVLPSTVRASLSREMQRYQTYTGFNNVALSYGSQVDAVVGGDGSDTYFVGGDSIEISDNGGVNTVKLPGVASSWTETRYPSDTGVAQTGKQYTNTNTSQVVTLIGGNATSAATWAETWRVQLYDPAKQALVHTKLSLSA